MKLIHNQRSDVDDLIDLLSSQELAQEKTRINIYLPKAVVKLIDALAKNESRGDLVSKLVVEKAKKNRTPVYSMFSPLEISDKELDTITDSWEHAIHDLSK